MPKQFAEEMKFWQLLWIRALLLFSRAYKKERIRILALVYNIYEKIHFENSGLQHAEINDCDDFWVGVIFENILSPTA